MTVNHPNCIVLTSEPLGHSTAEMAEPTLTHNELITMAFEAVRLGKLGPYDAFDLSVGSLENPIQMVLRHQKSGRIKVANIDRRNGSIYWDTKSILWN